MLRLPLSSRLHLSSLLTKAKVDAPVCWDAVLALMEAIDAYVPDPVRALDKPFAMPIEDVFSIQVGGKSVSYW